MVRSAPIWDFNVELMLLLWSLRPVPAKMRKEMVMENIKAVLLFRSE